MEEEYKLCMFCKRFLNMYCYNLFERLQNGVHPYRDVLNFFPDVEPHLSSDKHICQECLYIIRCMHVFKNTMINALLDDDSIKVSHTFQIFQNQMAPITYDPQQDDDSSCSDHEHETEDDTDAYSSITRDDIDDTGGHERNEDDDSQDGGKGNDNTSSQDSGDEDNNKLLKPLHSVDYTYSDTESRGVTPNSREVQKTYERRKRKKKPGYFYWTHRKGERNSRKRMSSAQSEETYYPQSERNSVMSRRSRKSCTSAPSGDETDNARSRSKSRQRFSSAVPQYDENHCLTNKLTRAVAKKQEEEAALLTTSEWRKEDVAYSCVINACLQSYKTFTELSEHAISVHEVTSNSLEIETYMADLQKYREDESTKSKEQKTKSYNFKFSFPCLLKKCFKTFSKFEDMTDHQISAHNLPANFWCEECHNRKFYTHEALTYHITNKHTFIINCLLCSKPMRNQYELQVHLENHKEFSFPCQYCDKFFLDFDSLKDHRNIHYLDTERTLIKRARKKTIIERVNICRSDDSESSESNESLERFNIRIQPGKDPDEVGVHRPPMSLSLSPIPLPDMFDEFEHIFTSDKPDSFTTSQNGEMHTSKSMEELKAEFRLKDVVVRLDQLALPFITDQENIENVTPDDILIENIVGTDSINLVEMITQENVELVHPDLDVSNTVDMSTEQAETTQSEDDLITNAVSAYSLNVIEEIIGDSTMRKCTIHKTDDVAEDLVTGKLPDNEILEVAQNITDAISGDKMFDRLQSDLLQTVNEANIQNVVTDEHTNSDDIKEAFKSNIDTTNNPKGHFDSIEKSQDQNSHGSTTPISEVIGKSDEQKQFTTNTSKSNAIEGRNQKPKKYKYLAGFGISSDKTTQKDQNIKEQSVHTTSSKKSPDLSSTLKDSEMPEPTNYTKDKTTKNYSSLETNTTDNLDISVDNVAVDTKVDESIQKLLATDGTIASQSDIDQRIQKLIETNKQRTSRKSTPKSKTKVEEYIQKQLTTEVPIASKSDIDQRLQKLIQTNKQRISQKSTPKSNTMVIKDESSSVATSMHSEEQKIQQSNQSCSTIAVLQEKSPIIAEKSKSALSKATIGDQINKESSTKPFIDKNSPKSQINTFEMHSSDQKKEESISFDNSPQELKSIEKSSTKPVDTSDTNTASKSSIGHSVDQEKAETKKEQHLFDKISIDWIEKRKVRRRKSSTRVSDEDKKSGTTSQPNNKNEQPKPKDRSSNLFDVIEKKTKVENKSDNKETALKISTSKSFDAKMTDIEIHSENKSSISPNLQSEQTKTSGNQLFDVIERKSRRSTRSDTLQHAIEQKKMDKSSSQQVDEIQGMQSPKEKNRSKSVTVISPNKSKIDTDEKDSTVQDQTDDNKVPCVDPVQTTELESEKYMTKKQKIISKLAKEGLHEHETKNTTKYEPVMTKKRKAMADIEKSEVAIKPNLSVDDNEEQQTKHSFEQMQHNDNEQLVCKNPETSDHVLNFEEFAQQKIHEVTILDKKSIWDGEMKGKYPEDIDKLKAKNIKINDDEEKIDQIIAKYISPKRKGVQTDSIEGDNVLETSKNNDDVISDSGGARKFSDIKKKHGHMSKTKQKLSKKFFGYKSDLVEKFEQKIDSVENKPKVLKNTKPKKKVLKARKRRKSYKNCSDTSDNEETDKKRPKSKNKKTLLYKPVGSIEEQVASKSTYDFNEEDIEEVLPYNTIGKKSGANYVDSEDEILQKVKNTIQKLRSGKNSNEPTNLQVTTIQPVEESKMEEKKTGRKNVNQKQTGGKKRYKRTKSKTTPRNKSNTSNKKKIDESTSDEEVVISKLKSRTNSRSGDEIQKTKKQKPTKTKPKVHPKMYSEEDTLDAPPATRCRRSSSCYYQDLTDEDFETLTPTKNLRSDPSEAEDLQKHIKQLHNVEKFEASSPTKARKKPNKKPTKSRRPSESTDEEISITPASLRSRRNSLFSDPSEDEIGKQKSTTKTRRSSQSEGDDKLKRQVHINEDSDESKPVKRVTKKPSNQFTTKRVLRRSVTPNKALDGTIKNRLRQSQSPPIYTEYDLDPRSLSPSHIPIANEIIIETTIDDIVISEITTIPSTPPTKSTPNRKKRFRKVPRKYELDNVVKFAQDVKEHTAARMDDDNTPKAKKRKGTNDGDEVAADLIPIQTGKGKQKRLGMTGIVQRVEKIEKGNKLKKRRGGLT